jgi:hypothetical protein|nr:MAG TPA: Myb2 [Caudoviricetes sp.]
MSKKYKAWTKEEVELLKKLMAKGEKTSVIAIRLQRPHGSVNVKKRELKSGNLRLRSFWTIDELRILKDLLQKGLTAKQMSEVMKRTKSAINNKLTDMGEDIWNEEIYQAYVC